MRNRSHPRPARPASAPVAAAPRRRALAAWAIAAAAAACDRDKPAPPPPPPAAPVAAPAPAAPAVTAPPPPATGWDAAAGLGLVVPGPDGSALLVVPGLADSAGVDTARADAPALPAQVTLFAESGVVGQARASTGGGGAGCASATPVRLGPASGADALPAWTVGLAAAPGVAAPAALPLDSLDVLAGPDSAALAAALTRLASALPAPGGVSAATRAALRGVPFRVRGARGFSPDGRARAVVAALTRTMNQEAAPAAHAVLLVAERPAGGGADKWRAVYSEQTAGREETLPAVHVLAAVRLDGPGAPRAALLIGREDDAGTRYGLLERAEPGRWKARWTSARVACGR